jgi:hypothetical protein
MASIDGVQPAGFRAEPPGLPASRRSAFALPDPAAESPGRAEVGGGMAISDVAVLPAGVLAAQEYGSEPLAERTARRQGMLVLRQLSRLQVALLGTGADDQAWNGDAWSHLASLATALEEAIAAGIDPRLRAVLGTLALRARIELARPRA